MSNSRSVVSNYVVLTFIIKKPGKQVAKCIVNATINSVVITDIFYKFRQGFPTGKSPSKTIVDQYEWRQSTTDAVDDQVEQVLNSTI